MPPGFSRQQTVSFIGSSIPRIATEKAGEDVNARFRPNLYSDEGLDTTFGGLLERQRKVIQGLRLEM